MKTQETIMLRNDLGELNRVMARADEFCRQHNVSITVNRRLNVVLDDLIANIICHGFDDGQAHPIELTLSITPASITVCLSDDGVPFDPLTAKLPDHTLPLERREPGGLGIELIRGLSDALSYERRGDLNLLTVSFNLDRT